MRAPFVWTFVFYSAGILTAGWIDLPDPFAFVFIIAALASLRIGSFKLALSSQLLLVFAAGILAMQSREELYRATPLTKWLERNEEESVRIRGVLLQTPELARDFFAIRLKVQSISGKKMHGIARITITGEMSRRIVAGDVIESFAKLRRPSNFMVDGAFDYRRYLKKEGIHALGTIKHPSLIRIVEKGSGPRSYISHLRLKMIERIRKLNRPADAGVLRAIWLDDRSGLDKNIERSMINAGVFHVVAISGFHVAVLLTLCFVVLKGLTSFRIASLLLCGLLLFYLLLLEGRSSITRSFLTFLILTFSLWKLEIIGKANVLCLSALLQIILNPMEIFDPGFHLTYLSTAGILFIAVPLCKVFPFKRKSLRVMTSFVILAVSIQVVLAPYQAIVFHKIPFGSLAANFIAVPLSSILIAVGPVILPFELPYRLAVPLISKSVGIFIGGSSLFDAVWLKVVPTPSILVVITFYLALLWSVLWSGWRIRILGAMLAAACLCSIVIVEPDSARNDLRIHFIDVGQGDAILIQYPDGTNDLIDGGGFWNDQALDIAEAVLLPYLCKLKVTNLNRIFLTHAHADHMNGLISLIRYFPPEKFYITRSPLAEPGFQRLIRETNGGVRSISRGVKIKQGSVVIHVLAPYDTHNTLRVANDDSLVLLLQYSGRQILFMGDAEKLTEDRLIASHEPMGIDVLKVGHHGSKTSSTPSFIDHMRPYSAVISAGRNNWFGHPDPSVISRFQDRHSVIWRTDKQGTICLKVRADGELYWTVSQEALTNPPYFQ